MFDEKIKNDLAIVALGQDFIAQAPLVVIGCIDEEIAFKYGERGKSLYSICDVSASIQNLMLLAREQGLGTCLEGSTELILNDGSIEKISDFVEKRITLRNEKLEIGTCNGDKVLSWRKFSPIFVNTLAVEKLPKIKKILKIKTQSGVALRATPDHKILIDTIDGPKLVRADEIKVRDYIYSPRKIDIQNNKFSILNFLLKNKFFIHLSKEYFGKIKNKLKGSYGSLKNAAEKLNISYQRLCYLKYPVDALNDLEKICKKLKITLVDILLKIDGISSFGSFYKIKSPFLTTELMYLLGLISSDGSIDEKDNHCTIFSNSESGMIKIFRQIYRKIFPGMGTRIAQKENSNFLVRVNNLLLTELAKSFKIKDDPAIIFKMDEKLIIAYIKGVFDGDGSASICYDKRKGYVIRIKISSSEKIFAERIRLLLKRVGIASALNSWISTGFSKGTRMYDVLIRNEYDILTFIKEIGSSRPINQKKFKWIRNFYLQNKNKGHASFMLAPLICGRLVKKIRKRHNIPANKIAPYASYLTNREGCRERTRKDIFEKFYKSLMKRCRDKELQILKEMISPKFYLDKIVEIKEKNPFNQNVFDITTSNTHLFIANGDFVVSNCWVGAFNEEEVSKILNLPVNLRPIVICPVGYPAEKPLAPPRISKKEAIEFR